MLLCCCADLLRSNLGRIAGTVLMLEPDEVGGGSGGGGGGTTREDEGGGGSGGGGGGGTTREDEGGEVGSALRQSFIASSDSHRAMFVRRDVDEVAGGAESEVR